MLAAELASNGVGHLYWYGYDQPEERAWAWSDLAAGCDVPLWCGDLLVVDDAGEAPGGGDLGAATTPGTGFGIVVANVSDQGYDRCARLGAALERLYRSALLPTGDPGGLDLRVITRGR